METLFGARQARVRPLLLGLTLASCVLLGIEKAGVGWLVPVRSVLATTVVPVQYVAETPYLMMNYLVEFFSTRDRLMRRNADLERDLLLHKAETARTDAILAENDRLRELLNSRARLPDDVIIAELIEVIPDPSRQEIVVDKGGAHGVAVGQAVIDSTGVFGQVVETTPLTSRVLLVTDPSHAIPVQVMRSQVFAIASGGGKGPHLLDNPPVTTDIVVGDDLVSSGLGRRFPRDYPVGVVTRVVKDPAQQYAQVVWEPSAALARSRTVLVVLGERQDEEQQALAVAEAEG
ncbi:MAG: rod shape-determining protein MreC [Pseudomonadales bacterium]|nr:rod shape-determining protein MreC [Pseudomonadales bacterium]